MGKIERSGYGEEFKAIQAQSIAAGEHRDCTVKAVAFLAGVSYEEAHRVCAAHGRKPRTGMTETGVRKALRSLGFSLTIRSQLDFISQYPGVHKNLKSITSYHPVRFASAFDDGKAYMAFTRGHVFAIVNGKTLDWSNERALRVTSIWEVEKV